MRVLGVLLTLLLLQCDLTSGATDPIFLVAVTSQTVGGSKETLCAQIHEIKEPLTLVVNLISENGNLTILQEKSITKDFYNCVSFQVPIVTVDSVASISVDIRGDKTSLNKTTQILIKPSTKLIFIQTDKPIYKPEQTIKFRIVSLDPSFLPHNQVFHTVELQDPYTNRIAQWLNQSTNSGILDLFHPTTQEATPGYYTITAWDEKNTQTSYSFEIKKYVLPKYEVNVLFPQVISPLDTEVTLKVCAKYTYGKSVQGSVKAEVCGKSFRYYWFRGPMPDMPEMDICKNFSLTTDKTGCASQVINVKEYGLNSGGYIQVNSKVEEDGTGVILEGSATASFTSEIIRVSFQDTSETYRPGIAFEGKVLVTDPQSKPMKNEQVYVIATYGNKSINVTLTTDSNGFANFSLNTLDWSEYISLQARHVKDVNHLEYTPFRQYQAAYHSITPFYSKSKSFVMLIKATDRFSCESDATVMANYIIPGNELKSDQKTLDFFYMVLSKGSMVQHGRLSVSVKYGTENKGQLSFSLKKTTALSPLAQVVVYTVLPSGEAAADSFDFPIETCLPNKVSLKFSSATALPGEKTSVNLKAHPGSLCSVRAIDQSVLLLKPEAELNTDFVYGMLPVQSLSGYPYEVEDPYPCKPPVDPIPIDPVPIDVAPAEPAVMEPRPEPPNLRQKRSRIFNPYYYYNRNDVYSVFKGIGVKIATNSDVRQPVVCYTVMNTFMKSNAMLDGPPMAMGAVGAGAAGAAESSDVQPVETVRTYLPETWIWDLVPVGTSGSVDIEKTVPDTITKWSADAFCTSPVGFGVAPNTNLTAFQPFFVSVTLPYSVIRGEVFTLKATVFNYLPKCIMVKATLPDSGQFSAKPCEGCKYTQCICAEESKTFQWIITPTALGEVNVTVRAETVQSKELCGNEVVTVPERGRIDTLVEKLLVEAEGTKKSVTQNELICLTDSPVEKEIALKLPRVIIKDSAKAFVTVLGDLMGRALKNIDNLLAMPYGCGEQNMLQFAPNIYILQYLESSKQLTPEIMSRAKVFMEGGYQRELTYKHDDGSYSAFGKSDASGNTWLTAFVMKSFGGARKYLFIDETHINQAKEWLGQQQQKNGCFASVGKLFHNEMAGGVSDEVTLTAYITAALLELGTNKSDPMVKNGLECLKAASSNLTNTYLTALLSYTFTLAEDAQMRSKLISILDRRAKKQGGGQYWTQGQNTQTTGSLDIEMSSYVLLALLSGPTLPKFGLGYSASIVRWLSQQQNAFGGFLSTQDTVVALQALAKYSAATYSPDGSLVVTVTPPSGKKLEFTVSQQNRLLYQEKQLQDTTGKYKLRAQGKGCAFVQFALHYNIPTPSDSSTFSIRANATGVCKSPKNTVLNLTVSVRFNGKREETNMVIINVKLLSGFIPVEASLETLKQDPIVKRIDQEEGYLNIYLEGLKKSRKSFSLQLLQDVPVQNLKPAVVKVYDYYKTSDQAVTEYTSPCA